MRFETDGVILVDETLEEILEINFRDVSEFVGVANQAVPGLNQFAFQPDVAKVLSFEIDNQGGAALTNFVLQLKYHDNATYFDYLSGTQWATDKDNYLSVGTSDKPNTLASGSKAYVSVALPVAVALRLQATAASDTNIRVTGVIADSDEPRARFLATSGNVKESLFDANTILYANADNTPLALTVGNITVIGRETVLSNIAALDMSTLLDMQKSVLGNVWKSGRFYDGLPFGGGNKSSDFAVIADRIYYVPIFVPHDIVLADLGIELTTADAGMLIIFGIVSVNKTTFEPSTVLLTTAAQSTTAIGYVGDSGLSFALAAGWYYAVFNSNSGVIATESTNTSRAHQVLGAATGAADNSSYLRDSVTYPSITPTGTPTYITSSIQPRIMLSPA